MLSAIAARKAAQAAKLTAASQPLPSPSKSGSDPEQESESDSARQIKSILQPQKSKRKPSENFEKPLARKKRRKKIPKAEPTQNRYYELRNGDELEEEGIMSSSSSDSDVHSAPPDLQEIIQPQRHRKTKRAWSPSVPPAVASDDESEPSAPWTLLPSTSGSHSDRTHDAGYQTPLSLSFVPQPEKNVFNVEDPCSNFLSGRKGTIVSLADNETIAFLGVYSLTVLRGTVSLLGTELHASASKSHTVFAPKCSPIPIIKAVPSSRVSACSLLDRFVRASGLDRTVIFLEDLDTGVEGLGRVCKTFGGAFETSSLGGIDLNLSGAKLLTSITRSLQLFQTPDSWLTALASLPSSLDDNDDDDGDVQSDTLIFLVRGQKRTGKSTLARMLFNRLVCRYRRVAYLECDVGQTEFTPPGLVSLHIIDRPIFGPPFTHPRLPYASHYIGAASPQNNPEHYLTAVSALLHTYRVELQHPAPEDELYDADLEDNRIVDAIPLVVNTMGWLKGLGADLSRQIEEVVVPTHIFCTQSPVAGMEEAFPMDRATFAGSVSDASRPAPRTSEVEAISPGPQSARYSAADWRILSLISYFYSIPSSTQYEFLPARLLPANPVPNDHRSPLCKWDCRLPLVAQVPYAVSPAEAIDNFVLTGAGMEDVAPSEIGRVLNGAIVALVSCERDVSEPAARNSRQTRVPYIQGSPPPDPSTSNCIGLALIRGVSPSLFDLVEQSGSEIDVLHVLTPLPPELIASSAARCLVKGEIELSVWEMLDYRELEHGDARASEIDVPYLQWSKGGAVGAVRRRIRRNIMRKGQM